MPPLPLVNDQFRLEEVLGRAWSDWNFNSATLEEAKEKLLRPIASSPLQVRHFTRHDGFIACGYGLTIRSFLTFALPSSSAKYLGYFPF